MPIKRIAVIGAGQMGAGIAHICAQANYEVLLQDKNESALTKGITTIEQSLTRAVQKERITEIEKERTLANITTTASLSEITEVDLAIEAVIEQLDVKQNIFASRSEEHTSELQSRGHLVCRLLLEKKKETILRP